MDLRRFQARPADSNGMISRSHAGISSFPAQPGFGSEPAGIVNIASHRVGIQNRCALVVTNSRIFHISTNKAPVREYYQTAVETGLPCAEVGWTCAVDHTSRIATCPPYSPTRRTNRTGDRVVHYWDRSFHRPSKLLGRFLVRTAASTSQLPTLARRTPGG